MNVVLASAENGLIPFVIACIFLGMLGALVDLIRRKWSVRDDPAYPWNQSKRQGPILPGASPEMLRAIEERNQKAKKK